MDEFDDLNEEWLENPSVFCLFCFSTIYLMEWAHKWLLNTKDLFLGVILSILKVSKALYCFLMLHIYVSCFLHVLSSCFHSCSLSPTLLLQMLAKTRNASTNTPVHESSAPPPHHPPYPPPFLDPSHVLPQSHWLHHGMHGWAEARVTSPPTPADKDRSLTDPGTKKDAGNFAATRHLTRRGHFKCNFIEYRGRN